MLKKNKVLPVAVTDEDLGILDFLISKTPFNVSRSEIACGLVRYGMNRISQGLTDLETIASMSSVGDLSPVFGAFNLGAKGEEMKKKYTQANIFKHDEDSHGLTLTCIRCKEKLRFTIGAERDEIIKATDAHRCEITRPVNKEFAV